MTRSEIYVEIKNYNLQDDIKDKYGYNYTNLSSATLIEEIKKYKNRNVQYELKFPNDRLDKLIDWIPHLKEMNVDAVYLGPIFESVEHGYDTIDYKIVDRRLGDNESFKKICDKLHENGKYVAIASGGYSENVIAHWSSFGADMLSAGADFDFIRDGAVNNRKNLEKIHKQ
jgi:hypothetical protein